MTADRPAGRPASSESDALVEETLSFLDRVYEIAESPSRLREALVQLAQLVGSPSVLLLSNEGGERRLVAAAHANEPNGRSHTSLHLTSDRVRTVPLSRTLELVVDSSGESPNGEELLLRLAPHLARAMRIADRHAHDDAGEQQSLTRLDRLALAVALLDPDGRVVAINNALRQLLATAGAIEISSHQIVLRSGVSRALFESVVERVVSPPDSERQFVGGRLSVDDAKWGRIDLLVAPYVVRISHSEVRAVVMFSATGISPAPEDRLRDICGLTPEEAQLAVEIVAGRRKNADPDPAQHEALVRSIYRKLGTTRQTDLLRLVLRPPGVVFESGSTRIRPA